MLVSSKRREYRPRVWSYGSYVPSLSWTSLSSALSRRMNGGIDGSALGIDLSKRAGEVRKLFYSGGFTGTIIREGLDPEEVLQEIYRGLLARNNGTCPGDYKKSSFGHYVHIVMKCVLINYLRKEKRRTSMEDLSEEGDVGAISEGSEGGADFTRIELLKDLFSEAQDDEIRKIESLVKALECGQTRVEASAALGVPTSWTESVLRRIRTEWGQ